MTDAPNPADGHDIRIVTDAPRMAAIAMALAYMADKEPFRNYALWKMTGTIIGAVDRGHYGFVLRGKRVVGFACYALSTEADARAWLERGEQLGTAKGQGGDVVVMLQAAFDDREATVRGLRHLAWLYPDYRWAQKRNEKAPLVWSKFPPRRAEHRDAYAAKGRAKGSETGTPGA